LAKVQAERRVPVHTERIEGGPFVAMCDVAFECGAMDMVVNSIFDLTRDTILIEGDGNFHWIKMVEFGSRRTAGFPVPGNQWQDGSHQR
jgi:hypothetical protein